MSQTFLAFLLPLLVSLGLTIVSALWTRSPWVGLLAVIPLMGYHLIYLARRKRQLTSAEVDSVYYFGFLITVAALAATAMEISIAEGPQAVSRALPKFGAGLLATGYAVLARLHLQSLTDVEETDLHQVFDTYLARSSVMLDNVEMAIRRFDDLAQVTMSETQRVAERSRSLLEESGTAFAKTLEFELRATLGAAHESVTAIRNVVADAQFAGERQAFARAIREGIAVSGELNAALGELRTGVRSGLESYQQADEAMSSLATSAGSLNDGMKGLLDAGGLLPQVATSIQATAESSARAAASAQQAAVGIVQLSRSTTQSEVLFAALGRSASSATEQVAGLAAASSRLNDSIAKLAEAIQVSRDFAVGLDGIGRELPSLVPKVRILGGELDSLKIAFTESSQALEEDVRRSTRAAGLLADSLAEVAQAIIDRTNSRAKT